MDGWETPISNLAARQENNLPLTALGFCKDGFPE